MAAKTKQTARKDERKRLSLYAANPHEERVFSEMRRQAVLQNLAINKVIINTFAEHFGIKPEESQAA